MNPRFISAPRSTAATSLPLLLLLSTFATSSLLRAETPKPKIPAAPAAPAAPTVAQDSNTVPYTLEVEEVKNSQMPALHSFASGYGDKGRWLLIGGRKAGLHGFHDDGSKNFPRDTANTIAYVVDPANNEVLGQMDLKDALAKRLDLLGPLTATNPEFVQVGNHLYIIGGYGKDLANTKEDAMVTFGSVIRINISGLITDIIDKLPRVIEEHIQRNPTNDRRLRVTGGQLKHHDGRFYIVFGQEFSGHYTVPTSDYNKAGGQSQTYTEKIRILTLNKDLSINQYTEVDGGYDATLPYHRRDLNVSDIIIQRPAANGKSSTEEAACVVYGGVFKAGQIGGHVHPVDIFYANPFSAAQTHDTAPTYARVRSDFSQGLNHYDCANFTIYDKNTGDSYTTLFGGISQFHYDAAKNTLIQDAINFPVDGLPFINTVSVIRHGAQGISQNIQPAPGWAPGTTLLGTDAQFLVHHSKLHPHAIMEGGVINLAHLDKLDHREHVIGHILGGIEAFGPYTGLITQGTSSQASTRLFKIKLQTKSSAVPPMPPLPSGTTPYNP